jgi:hypothetical protein
MSWILAADVVRYCSDNCGGRPCRLGRAHPGMLGTRQASAVTTVDGIGKTSVVVAASEVAGG